MATQLADPYQSSAACKHASLEAGAVRLSSGEEAKPILMYLGVEPPSYPDPAHFQGDIYQEITWEGEDLDGRQIAELRIVRFNMVGTHPQFGNLTVTLDTSRPGGVASLRAQDIGSKFPVVHTTRIHVTALSSVLPGVILQNQGPPLKFVGEPSRTWPPEQTVYTLAIPVRFEDRGSPGVTLATASSGSVIVGVMGAD